MNIKGTDVLPRCITLKDVSSTIDLWNTDPTSANEYHGRHRRLSWDKERKIREKVSIQCAIKKK
jgi:hypothetical protein